MSGGYEVLIRRVSDGLERWSGVHEWYGEDEVNPGLILFSWRENNFACDCNRHLVFERAGGRPEAELWGDETPCGDDVLYEVVGFRDTNGRVIDEAACKWVRPPQPDTK